MVQFAVGGQYKLARILITIGTLIYALNMQLLFSHVGIVNPTWIPYARLHGFWLIASVSFIALFALYILWRNSQNQIEQTNIAGFLGIFVMGGYVLAAIMAKSYGGSLNPLAKYGAGGVTPDITFVASKDIIFGLSAICLVVGLVLVNSHRAEEG